MGRRDPDPRPPVEFLGDEPPTDPVHTVEVGGTARRGARGRGMAAVALVGALLVAGLALGDDDGGTLARSDEKEERDNSLRVPFKNTTTTTVRPAVTTTTAPPVPLLPGAGARVLLIGERSGVELLDLATGTSTDIRVGADAYAVVPVAGGAVVLGNGFARHLRLPAGAPPGDSVDLGAAEQVWASGDPESVWLTGVAVEPDATGLRDVTAARLVDLSGDLVAGPFSFEEGYVVGAHPRGLILHAAGRIYVVGPSGGVQQVAVGEALGVSEGWLLARTCDEQAECALSIWGPDLGAPRQLGDGLGNHLYGELVVQPGGDRAALLLYGRSGAQLALLDLTDGVVETVDGLGSAEVTDAAWLPGDLGLLVAQPSQLWRVHERAGAIVVDRLRDRGALQLAVIPG